MDYLLKDPRYDHQVRAQVGVQVATEVADLHPRVRLAVPTACPSFPRERGQVTGSTQRHDSAMYWQS